MAIEFTNLVGDWRRIVEDYVTDPGNAADAPGVEGTITVTPLLGEGRHAPRGVPSGGVFYTFAPLDLRVYRGLLMDENMNSDITVAIEVDEYPVAWRARFDLQYRRIKIPLQDVIFGPNEIVSGQINLSSLVTRDGLPPEYEGSYVQLMDAVRLAVDHADRAELAAGNVDDAVAGAADVVVAAVQQDRNEVRWIRDNDVFPARDAAAGSASAAALSAGAASGSASAAAGSAGNAADSALAAASSAEDAELWATSFGLTASATTGAPGTNASVTVTGTGPEYGLALTIPRGDKGEQGVQGAKGTTGDTGPKGDKGDTGTKGDTGDTGPKGDKGDKGDQGEPGPKGDPGDPGQEGPQGPPGADGGSPTWDGISGKPAAFPPETHTHTSSQVSDATVTGRAVMAAVSQAAARTAIGAGTSNLALGTTASTAKAGNYQPTWAQVTGKPSVFPPEAHAHTAAEVGAEPAAWSGTQAQFDALGAKNPNRTYYILDA